MLKGISGLTIASLLKTMAANYPEHRAVVDIDGDKKRSYREVNSRANRLAHALLKLGINKGCKAAMFMNDSVEVLEIIFALNKIGAVWTLCNYRFTSNEAKRQIDHSDSAILFFHEEYKQIIEEINSELPKVKDYVVVGRGGDTDKYWKYESLFEGASQDEPDIEIFSTDPIGIIYTSGTTGTPKGAVHTNQTFLGWALCGISNVSLSLEDNILNPYPMFHMGGTVISTMSIFSGSTNYILGKFDPLKFLRVIEQEKISVVAAIPTIVQMVNTLPESEKNKYSLSSVRTLLTSGAPFLTETQNAFEAQWPHIRLHSTYSATEAYFSNLRPDDQHRKTRCVGPGVLGTELKLVDDNGNRVPNGRIGCVYVKGISVFKGYYKNEEANEKSFREDWFTCEDAGYMDEEGYLYLVDRKKDIIISGGENIASVEVEQLLIKHPDVAEVAVIGVPHEKWGESVHAVVALNAGSTAGSEEIIDWCREKIAGFKRPRSVSIISELPKSPTGKILKQKLRDSYWKKQEGDV